MKYTRLFIVGLLLIATHSLLFSQSNLQPLIDDQQDFQQKAMLVLGGWGIANAVAGGIGMTTTEGSWKYFHQMNLGWGVINAGIAAFGYYGAQQFALDDPINISLLNKNLSLSKAFLFNAGLDIGYVAGGFYLRERSKNVAKLPERLEGFGNSIILQGAFLFTFDLIAYAINNKHTQLIQEAIIHVGSTENGVGMLIQF